ncbi:hypothetical protein Daura_00590 [Dactylosporangium aurantiacum]|uniref:Uncharacterized protein n=1 Tax=Dactylosporangium aurantiacum TaxID=35754 RepID=A0A9Q9IIL1_9ACTN|nr:DUF6232 family protein [Dactylosporangium aurantiacum]MDG6101138.1 DUF6232 family protein [Dactylosporangium aurantiacum]UWZ54830.1 hypothetical protein Daura_00590 [Dactylosporangium aurantiacum]
MSSFAPQSSESRPVVHYDRHGILVTDQVFATDSGRYEIAELTRPTHGTGALHPGVRACMAVGLANALVLGVAAATTGSIAVVLVALSALLITWAVGLFYARRWPRQHTLLADYRGRQVTLLRTRDADLFGRVSRALRRSVETARDR